MLPPPLEHRHHPKVIELEDPPADWGFKAHKQTMKLRFRRTEFEQMLDSYSKLLVYIKTAVARNYSEKSINNMMDLIATSHNVEVYLSKRMGWRLLMCACGVYGGLFVRQKKKEEKGWHDSI